MVETINFREFYQKKPIPIHPNDRLAIQNESNCVDIFQHFTHWLIALEGNEFTRGQCQWRVLIYPSDEGGGFNYWLPFFRTSYLASFHEALEVLKEFESKANQDQLMTIQR